MKFDLKKNIYRKWCRIIIACIFSILADYFFSATHLFLIPITTLFVMLTETGNNLYQGLLRYFLIVFIVTFTTIALQKTSTLMISIYDVSLGATFGILINLFIFPDRIDIEFRQTMIPILQTYSVYFSAIINNILNPRLKKQNHIDSVRLLVEKKLIHLPQWPYGRGFDITLCKGYRFFLDKTNQIGEILFILERYTHYIFDKKFSNTIIDSLKSYEKKIMYFFSALITVLNQQKISEGVEDIVNEITEIENHFKQLIPLPIDLMDSSSHYLAVAEFIYLLKELRFSLIKLGEALR